MKRAKSAFHFLRKVIESVLARESLPDKATSLKKQKTKNKEKTIRSKNNDEITSGDMPRITTTKLKYLKKNKLSLSNKSRSISVYTIYQ